MPATAHRRTGKKNVYFPKDLTHMIDNAPEDFNLSQVCQDAVRKALLRNFRHCRVTPYLETKRDGIHYLCDECGHDEALGRVTYEPDLQASRKRHDEARHPL